MPETIQFTKEVGSTELMLRADPMTGVFNGGHLRTVTRLMQDGEVLHIIENEILPIAGALQPGHGFEKFVSMVDQQLAATVVSQMQTIAEQEAQIAKQEVQIAEQKAQILELLQRV